MGDTLLKKLTVKSAYEDDILNGYLTVMLWASTDLDDEEGTPLDENYDVDDISEETIKESLTDIKSFCEMAEESGIDLTKYDTEKIGHDFFLTRCHHGAGFWDGDYEDDDGKKLTEISHTFGNVDPYAGDDGKIYISR